MSNDEVISLRKLDEGEGYSPEIAEFIRKRSDAFGGDCENDDAEDKECGISTNYEIVVGGANVGFLQEIIFACEDDESAEISFGVLGDSQQPNYRRRNYASRAIQTYIDNYCKVRLIKARVKFSNNDYHGVVAFLNKCGFFPRLLEDCQLYFCRDV